MCNRFWGVLAVLSSIAISARSQVATQETWQVADKVKAAVQSSLASATPPSGAVRDTSQLDVKSIFTKFGYTLGHETSSVLSNKDINAQYIQLRSPEGRHDDEVRLTLITGIKAEHARMGILECMGTRITLPINSNTFRTLNGGPGEICFVMPLSVGTNTAEITVEKRIWFSRDNVGVELACSGSKNLLPLAKAIDQAVQVCREKNAPIKDGSLGPDK